MCSLRWSHNKEEHKTSAPCFPASQGTGRKHIPHQPPLHKERREHTHKYGQALRFYAHRHMLHRLGQARVGSLHRR